MLYFIISILGLFVGGLLAFISPEEMKDGQKYFKIICLVLVLCLIVISCIYSFNIWLFIIGLVLGMIFYNEYFYFGLLSVSSIISGINIITYSCLIFIYGLAGGSMLYHNKRYLGFLSNILLFFIPFLLYFLNVNLIGLAAGGLTGIVIRRLKKRDYF